jgi:ABC-type lipoprotein release transport system permease subunit
MNRPNVVNLIVVKMDDAFRAREAAAFIEHAIGYKSVSWQEASKDLLDALTSATSSCTPSSARSCWWPASASTT